MKLSLFIKDKLVFIIGQLVIFLFVGSIMWGMNMGTPIIIFLVSGAILLDTIALVTEYLKRVSFYKRLRTSMERLDKKHLISELLEAPHFVEGDILCEVLAQATKSMNDEIAKYKLSQEEYKEYIETWIHEIKTPIACIQLLCENNKSEFTKSISDESNKIDNFVEQVLFYARSTALEKDYVIRRIELNTMIKSILKKHSRQMIENKIQVKFNSLNTTVFTDSKWIDFIIGQIIANCIKYKGGKPELLFDALENEKQVVLRICDNGVGIVQKDLSRIFDKGFTGENGRKYAKSTGIGLYLCKRLCDKMNLGMTLTSVLGEGTKVSIIFPKDKALFFES